ncbi:MAG: DegT/DnrJ/EryC1/StrS family aminotransferase [Pirellulales bacterium]|nr:DegT/DnrJ/EryC1/StrS family aminotransferase [Pirellulales bacterium]
MSPSSRFDDRRVQWHEPGQVTLCHLRSLACHEKMHPVEFGMIPFQDLKPIAHDLAAELRAAAERVLASGWYVLGPEVEAFEAELARWLGATHAVGVANGTDALELALRGAGVVPGDEVITVAHTAVATVTAIERAGAKPVLVDVEPETLTMCPRAAEAAVGPHTRAIVPVHLYGHPADLTALEGIARRHGLLLIEDGAQAIGATDAERMVGTWGNAAAFSFYPTKNLGACGDAGAVVTNDAALAARVRRLRMYGQSRRDCFVEPGINSRLDELQAALLRVKLPHLVSLTEQRRALARDYHERLIGVVRPHERAGAKHVYHLYVVRHDARDLLAERLAAAGVETLIHYRTPAHLQPAFAHLGYAAGSLPETERAAHEVLSLPLYWGLSSAEVATICDAVRDCTVEVRS